ncbi:hypothetical protein EX30DRAFT_395072 [Ascodesmis nigricans]|uniref:Uncharacterized protein n=1 Tax=Ascodesmis nigricans TaxID=341454 RepID=A0A4S2MZQ9_9PEZI|nr:hypothetical protein EX30DRAFT_395072 [Ascodesmis nigricans]
MVFVQFRHSSRITSTVFKRPPTIATRFYSARSKVPPSSAHATRKGHELDVQSHSVAQGIRERKAAETVAERGPRKDLKEGYPEAPYPVIGMEDERGSKGA